MMFDSIFTYMFPIITFILGYLLAKYEKEK